MNFDHTARSEWRQQPRRRCKRKIDENNANCNSSSNLSNINRRNNGSIWNISIEIVSMTWKLFAYFSSHSSANTSPFEEVMANYIPVLIIKRTPIFNKHSSALCVHMWINLEATCFFFTKCWCCIGDCRTSRRHTKVFFSITHILKKTPSSAFYGAWRAQVHMNQSQKCNDEKYPAGDAAASYFITSYGGPKECNRKRLEKWNWMHSFSVCSLCSCPFIFILLSFEDDSNSIW